VVAMGPRFEAVHVGQLAAEDLLPTYAVRSVHQLFLG
jgi:hypothetical protein